MSVCKCCTNIYDLGCKVVCDELELPLEALLDGDHKVFIEYKGQTFEYVCTVVYIGENITIPANLLNENYEHIISVTDPDGEELIYEYDGVEYDCFKVQTKVGILAQPITVQGEHYRPNE